MRPQLGKQKLFDAAMKLFESHGYFSTTVAQITAEAGVSKGLVYNYFDSKKDLLVALLEDATDKMTAAARPLASGASLRDSLALFLGNFLNLLQAERQFLKLQLTLMMTPELKLLVAEPRQRRAAQLLAILGGWLRAAQVAEPKPKARLLVALLDGVALHYLCIYERYPLRSMQPQLLRAALDICAAPESKNSPD